MYENPVLWKELKTRYRFRQGRTVKIVVAVPVVLLALMGYREVVRVLLESGGATARDMWQAAAWMQAVLIWLLCPSAASNAVTQEKEQRTWDMLIYSLLRPIDIVIGKFVSRVFPVLGLLLFFAPFMVMAQFMGGMPLSDVLPYALFVVLWIVYLLTLSLFCSWMLKKTAAALAVSYSVAFFFVLGTVLLSGIVTAGQNSGEAFPMWFNPVRLMIALMDKADPLRNVIMGSNVLLLLVMTAGMFAMMLRRATPALEG